MIPCEWITFNKDKNTEKKTKTMCKFAQKCNFFLKHEFLQKLNDLENLNFFFHGDVPFKLEVLWPHVGEGQGLHLGEVPAPPRHGAIGVLI